MRTESRELPAIGIFRSRSRTADRIETLLKRHREFSPQVSLVRPTASTSALPTFAGAGAVTPRWIAFAHKQAGRRSK